MFLINCSQNEIVHVQQQSEPFIFQATEDNILTRDFSASEAIAERAEEVIVADNNGNLFGQGENVEDVTDTYARRNYVHAQSESTELSPTPIDHNSFLRPPQWIPDSDAPRCMSCSTQFTPFRRRHHCRNCGLIFCHFCSKNTAVLIFSRGPVRVCNECFLKTQTEGEALV